MPGSFDGGALLLTLKMASWCGYSDGGTSRNKCLDLVMKAIRSVITCPDFDINSGHLHFIGMELKSSYLMMGMTTDHSDGHVTFV